MSKLRISVRVRRDDLDAIDELVDAGVHRTRSHAVRAAISDLIGKHGRNPAPEADRSWDYVDVEEEDREGEVRSDGGSPRDRIRPVTPDTRPERRRGRELSPATVLVERAGDHRDEQVVVKPGESRTLEVHGVASVTVAVPEDDDSH